MERYGLVSRVPIVLCATLALSLGCQTVAGAGDPEGESMETAEPMESAEPQGDDAVAQKRVLIQRTIPRLGERPQYVESPPPPEQRVVPSVDVPQGPIDEAEIEITSKVVPTDLPSPMDEQDDMSVMEPAPVASPVPAPAVPLEPAPAASSESASVPVPAVLPEPATSLEPAPAASSGFVLTPAAPSETEATPAPEPVPVAPSPQPAPVASPEPVPAVSSESILAPAASSEPEPAPGPAPEPASAPVVSSESEPAPVASPEPEPEPAPEPASAPVVPSSALASAATPAPVVPSSSSALASVPAALDGDLTRALALLSRRLVAQGLALVRALDLSLAADPVLVSQVADYSADEDPALAVVLYQKNIAQAEPFGQEASARIIDLELAQGDRATAQIYALEALERGHLPSAAALLSISEYLLQLAQYGAAAQFLDLFADQYPAADAQDHYLWVSGQLFEQDIENHDTQAAILHYEQIVDFHPLSAYWEPARARAAYLRRHFIDLR